MEQSHTTKWQRIAIWAIAIIMTVGSIGAYFIIILENNNQKNQQTNTQKPSPEQKVDPSAHKLEGKVDKLEIIDLVVGTGEEVKPGDTVRMHYKGTLGGGEKFDSSFDRGEPLDISLKQVIQGWQEGVPGMKEGGKRRLIIPAAMAYGEAGSPPTIPANADLVFEVELIKVNPPAPEEPQPIE